MLSRALILATVLLSICTLPGRALAQENLDAGKSPSQIFAGTCNACHKSPRGLLKTVSPSSLPSFLRQHYTTSSNMAGVLSSYLVSNGATDTRYGEAAKGAKGVKEGAKEGAREGARERQEVRHRPEGEPGTQANPDHADGRNGAAKQRLSKRSRPEEPATTPIEPKPDLTKPDLTKPEAAKPELAKPDSTKPDSAKDSAKGETASREEGTKPDAPKTDERAPQSAKIEQPAETSAIRPDPIPPVTPAPPTAAESLRPQSPSAATTPAGTPPQAPTPPSTAAASPTQASVAPAGTEMAVPLSPSQLPPAPPPGAVVVPSVPLAPVAPAGAPTPPISQ
jgi:hypothetical protein